MPAFLLGVVALFLLLWAASSFIKADPKEVARAVRWIGGGAALLLAGFLLFRGAIAVAIPLGAFGARSTRLDILLADSFRGANTKKHGPGVAGVDGFP